MLKWTINFLPKAEKQLKKLPKQTQKRILEYLYLRVRNADHPTDLGKSLTGTHKGLWRYRVGDYRIICQIEEDVLNVMVLGLGHRSDIYK